MGAEGEQEYTVGKEDNAESVEEQQLLEEGQQEQQEQQQEQHPLNNKSASSTYKCLWVKSQ